MALRELSLREFKQRPGRNLLTLMSIVIGAGAIVATSLASNSTQQAQVAMVEVVTGHAALEIYGVGGASFESRSVESIPQVPGVRVASPSIRRYASMSIDSTSELDQKDPKPNWRHRVQLLGVDPELDQQVRNYSLVTGEKLADGKTVSDKVHMDAVFAKAIGIQLHTSIRLLTKSGVQSATVVGFVKANDANAVFRSALVIATLQTVQKWSRAANRIDVLQLVLEPNASIESVENSIANKLPEGVIVRPPIRRTHMAEESTRAMRQAQFLASAFALTMAALMIFNTFQMNVGERRMQLGILRALGTTRKQILWMILREAFWLSAIGSALGCVGGYFGAQILKDGISAALQIDIPDGAWSITPYMVAISCTVSVSLLGALVPALFAASLSPCEAMRVVARDKMGYPRLFSLGMGLLALGIGVTIQLLSARETIHIQFGNVGVLLLALGSILALPATLPLMARAVAIPLSMVFHSETQLAVRQILRHRERSSLTIGIMLIAMGMGLAMASTIFDNIANIRGWYQRTIVGDFFLRAALPDMNSGQAADMPEGLWERVSLLPGVETADTMRFVSARTMDTSVVVVVRKFNSKTQDYFDLIEGNADDVLQGIRDGQVVIGSVLSERLGLHRGNPILLETNEGTTSLTIAGVTNDYVAAGLTLFMEADYAKRYLSVDGTDAILVKGKKSDLKQLELALRSLCESEGLLFQSYAELVELIENTLNGAIGGLWAMLTLGWLIAAFGLTNTLGMNVLEQTREIGMLRVVAMTRWQVRRMIFSQAMIMALIGILPGLIMGVWIAYMMNQSTKSYTGYAVPYQLHPMLLLSAFLFEMLVILAAAIIPAERAARLNLSVALQYE